MAAVERVDAIVIGGGPAGATAGRLLAEWGHTVAVIAPRPRLARSLAESIPPSTSRLFDFLGLRTNIDHAGFYRSTGNTAWWGEAGPRVGRFDGAPGYQVRRAAFDRVLLDAARRSAAAIVEATARVEHLSDDGVRIVAGTARIDAPFAIDCSGRTGVIARRRGRVAEQDHTTLALTAEWERPGGWALDDESHTLVETYADGWAWSIPLSKDVRDVTVMIDRPGRDAGPPADLARRYRRELEKTRHIRELVRGSALLGRPWSCDASLYCASTFAGSNWLLAGDAGSFIDPLSSFGVKKALASGWLAAVVVHTALVNPAMRARALDFFDDRERRVYANYLRQSVSYCREAAERHPGRFWTRRANTTLPPADAEPNDRRIAQDPEVCATARALQEGTGLAFRLDDSVRIETRCAVAGREIVLEDRLVCRGLPDGLRFVGGVALPILSQLAPAHHVLSDLHAAYNRAADRVELPALVTALAALVTHGALIDGSAG